MDENGCYNCKILSKQCFDLENELETLKLRIDNITDFLSLGKADKNCQKDLFFNDSSCQLENINVSDQACQTETIPNVITEAVPVLAPSNMDVDVSEDLLYDIFIEANKKTITPISPCHFLPNQPFNQFEFDILDIMRFLHSFLMFMIRL